MKLSFVARLRKAESHPEDQASEVVLAEGAGNSGLRPAQLSRLRSFDPIRLGDFEYRAWVGYYLRKWPQVLIASVGLVKVGFGMSWARTLRCAWLILRANQMWAPIPDNDPERARAYMQKFYALVRLTYGEPPDPLLAATLEVDWWRAHRQMSEAPAVGRFEELIAALTRLYSYLFHEPAVEVRPAAAFRARAMELSDQWMQEGSSPDSPLLPLERAALVRAYAALLAAVHHY